MDNNQFNNNQMSGQGLETTDQLKRPKVNLPFNGDTKSFRANLPNTENASIGGAPIQGQAMQNPVNMVPQMQNQMSQGPMTQAQNSQMMPKKKHTGLIIALITVLVLAVGGVSSYFLFLTPEKRFERAMNKAEAAYEDGNYKSAASYYDKALGIHDDDFDAMYGKLISNHAKGDIKELKSDYNSFTKKILSMDESVLADKDEELTEIFLMSRDIFEGDDDKIIEELERGMSVTENKELLDEWTSIKLDQAFLLEEDNKESAIEMYASVLERATGNEVAIERMGALLKELLEYYIAIYAYEPAQELVDTYRGTISTINFTDYEARINQARVIAEQGIPLLQKVQEAMAAYDYDLMCEIDFSDETALFVPYVNNCFIYAEDGFSEDYTGIAVGIYRQKNSAIGDLSYYYYGEYVNGVRCGQGVAFCGMDLDTHMYELYDGAWADDLPNGYGVSGTYNQESNDEVIDTLIVGNFVDCNADGEMEASITSSAGYTVTGTFTADHGEVFDIRDQYPDYDFGMGDDRIIYVVMENDEVTWWLSKSLTSRIDAAYWIGR